MDEVQLTQNRVSIAIYIESLKVLGVSASELSWVISPQTLSYRKKKNEALTQQESGRWLRAAKVHTFAKEVFGNQAKANQWLRKNRNQFGGQSAASIIQAEPGAQLIEDTLNQIDAGYLA
ncbi:antitoxin Xre/MbcA/ParS toxin-binding domain-containing protein [Teredinibacter turnerae]|uniref:antitoxin Xre/MbcA/ParS toxin-binding domain-containing protein n=1 Tax=Teredinibacter turnerae TaxID=2426 RepID=UPI00036D800F|nr:antitoxin Xre/MbcA/ParS toxin-binding domain-containing protein [Teredinibacter turnerae]